MHTNLLSAQQIYAGDSLKENGIFIFSSEWITKPHVKSPLIIHDEGGVMCDEYSCKTKLKHLCLKCLNFTLHLTNCSLFGMTNNIISFKQRSGTADLRLGITSISCAYHHMRPDIVLDYGSCSGPTHGSPLQFARSEPEAGHTMATCKPRAN